tara:strand:- start:136 stop:351 length:216 start_codon:yes stop_codon:yes gene_type:complete
MCFSDPTRNDVDRSFIEELNQHISNEAVSTLIQDYIKELVSHEVDCMTSSGWFDDQLYKAVKDREDENETN